MAQGVKGTRVTRGPQGRLLSFKEYQASARSTAIYPEIEHRATYPILGLTNEAGELAGKWKKVFRDDGGVVTDEVADELKAELGDCLWYLAMTAFELGFDLQDVATENLNKLHDRKRRNTLRGSGDTR